MRLLVACQDGGIYIFEVGPGPLDSASKGMPCQEVVEGREEEAEGAPNVQGPPRHQWEVQPSLHIVVMINTA